MTDETRQFDDYINGCIGHDQDKMIIGEIAKSLFRLAKAQEELVALAKLDLEETINNEIESRAKEKAEELVAEKQARSFIGRR